MTDPEIGGRAPIAIEVEAGQVYWWCALRAFQDPAVLRRVSQNDQFHADRVQS